ncbi:MAG: type VI secretion system protein TssA [Gammaproteobacteria bacterium]|nr:type VI secretion system protein TssA [Gammaproteobacteria bacterium]
MASLQHIDINSLVEPLTGDIAVGVDLRHDVSPASDYSKLRDARKAARIAERNSLFDGNSSEADEHWRTVLELAPKLLKSESKDLEMACWYTEALLRKHGFRGLHDGFTLIRELIEHYWDDIYPLPDEDGISTRVAALTGLNGEGAEGVLIAPMRSVPITENADQGAFSYWQYKQALDAQRITDEDARADAIAKNGFSLDDIQRAVEYSSQEFFVNLRQDLQGALNEYKNISTLLDEHCGIHDSPPTSNITNTLIEIQGAISHIAQHKLPQDIETEEDSEDHTVTSTTSSAVKPAAVKSRDEAFRQLTIISQFFRQTEPHSPISYVLEKAVKWGNMPLGELIQELIPDSNSRDTYSSLTGVKTSDD